LTILLIAVCFAKVGENYNTYRHAHSVPVLKNLSACVIA